jgi:hypothetical protein
MNSLPAQGRSAARDKHDRQKHGELDLFSFDHGELSLVLAPCHRKQETTAASDRWKWQQEIAGSFCGRYAQHIITPKYGKRRT